MPKNRNYSSFLKWSGNEELTDFTYSSARWAFRHRNGKG